MHAPRGYSWLVLHGGMVTASVGGWVHVLQWFLGKWYKTRPQRVPRPSIMLGLGAVCTCGGDLMLKVLMLLAMSFPGENAVADSLYQRHLRPTAERTDVTQPTSRGANGYASGLNAGADARSTHH